VKKSYIDTVKRFLKNVLIVENTYLHPLQSYKMKNLFKTNYNNWVVTRYYIVACVTGIICVKKATFTVFHVHYPGFPGSRVPIFYTNGEVYAPRDLRWTLWLSVCCAGIWFQPFPVSLARVPVKIQVKKRSPIGTCTLLINGRSAPG